MKKMLEMIVAHLFSEKHALSTLGAFGRFTKLRIRKEQKFDFLIFERIGRLIKRLIKIDKEIDKWGNLPLEAFDHEENNQKKNYQNVMFYFPIKKKPKSKNKNRKK